MFTTVPINSASLLITVTGENISKEPRRESWYAWTRSW